MNLLALSVIQKPRTGRTQKVMMNIGENPTFADVGFGMEVHLFDFKGTISGRTIRVNFIDRIRDEKRFRSVEGLIKQLKQDEITSRRILQSIS